MSHNIRIAVDGPAGSGKSTIAKKIAKKTGMTYVDTGAMYRGITHCFLKKEIDLDDKRQVDDCLASIEIELEQDTIVVNGENVTEAIRTPEVTAFVSEVSQLLEVRVKLVNLQKLIAKKGNVIMDGRDIGTCVIPDAEFKFFLTASVAVRAKRRYLEMVQKGYEVIESEIAKEIEQRDKQDTERLISPLKKASDAIEIDTSDKTIDQVVDAILLNVDNFA